MKYYIDAKFPLEAVPHRDLKLCLLKTHYNMLYVQFFYIFTCASAPKERRHCLSLLLGLLDMAGLCRKMSQG